MVKERIAYLANLQILRLHLETEIDALHEAYHEIASCLCNFLLRYNQKLLICILLLIRYFFIGQRNIFLIKKNYCKRTDTG